MKISFIGGGNMATALISGLANKVTEGKHIHVVDLNDDKLAKLTAQFGVTTSLVIDQAISQVDVIVLAVKPQHLKDTVAQLKPFIKPEQIIVSIAAGIRMQDLSQWLGGHAYVVRAMPNTPALIGQGVTGLVASEAMTQSQKDEADAILKAVGKTVWLSHESLIDAVTGVSGSGPAYVFYFIEAMQEAAQQLGLTAEQGVELAKYTFLGASSLAVQSEDSVSVLREKVTSKGGTTYAALVTLDKTGVKEGIISAVKAAAARGKELGEEFGKA